MFDHCYMHSTHHPLCSACRLAKINMKVTREEEERQRRARDEDSGYTNFGGFNPGGFVSTDTPSPEYSGTTVQDTQTSSDSSSTPDSNSDFSGFDGGSSGGGGDTF